MLGFPFLRVMMVISVSNSMYHYMYVSLVFSATVIKFWFHSWMIYSWYVDSLAESAVHSALPFVHLYLGKLFLIAPNTVIKLFKLSHLLSAGYPSLWKIKHYICISRCGWSYRGCTIPSYPASYGGNTAFHKFSCCGRKDLHPFWRQLWPNLNQGENIGL